MKNIIILFILSASIGVNPMYTQSIESEMPGENLSLEGVLELFKSAKSIENFEELLNSEDNEVNNLDLDSNGEVDFIRIESHQENDAHAITLQVAINKNETQDIAVIAIEKTDKETATLQIIGDEDIYGEEKIVEQYETQGESNGKGPHSDYSLTRVIVNVWLWPSVRYIYRPAYRVYVSPWYWGLYPKYWRPWRSITTRLYRRRVKRWSYKYRVTPTIRVVKARRIYTPRRKTSITIVNNYKVQKTAYVKRKKVVKNAKSAPISRKKNTTKNKSATNKKVSKVKNSKVKKTKVKRTKTKKKR